MLSGTIGAVIYLACFLIAGRILIAVGGSKERVRILGDLRNKNESDVSGIPIVRK